MGQRFQRVFELRFLLEHENCRMRLSNYVRILMLP